MGKKTGSQNIESEFERMLRQEDIEGQNLHQFEESTPPRDKKYDTLPETDKTIISLGTVLDKLSYLNKVSIF